MQNLKELYSELSGLTVFRTLLSEPLFESFFKLFSEGASKEDRLRAYGEFCSEIYESGASLTALTKRLVFENENVYVRRIAHGDSINECINSALLHELSVLREFASLTTEDFISELGADYLSPFVSEPIELSYEYAERVEKISSVGYGIFSSYPMFRLSDAGDIEPIISRDKISIDSFIGYEEERGQVLKNTEAFVEGRPAANVLLCGDAGTGKSSTVKAITNHLFDRGVRLIELRKDQLGRLPYVMGKISDNPLKFIIFIDDLSFNKSDDNFSMLKAALEGSASAKADNAVIYATSNRRHIIKESFEDREGSDVHVNDTLQEMLSLSERFGLVVLFSKPNKQLYLEIVHNLADRCGIKTERAELDVSAEAFALRRGNRSARCAEQFIESLL